MQRHLLERYKQADLESIALKYVHRRSQCYLITLSQDDAAMVNTKQKAGDVIGLDQAVCATHNDFNLLVKNLKDLNLVVAPSIDVIETNQIVTVDKVREIFPK